MRNFFAPNQTRETYWLPPKRGGTTGYMDELYFQISLEQGTSNNDLELSITAPDGAGSVQVATSTNAAVDPRPVITNNMDADPQVTTTAKIGYDQTFLDSFTTEKLAAKAIVAGGFYKTTVALNSTDLWLRIQSLGVAGLRIQLNTTATLIKI